MNASIRLLLALVPLALAAQACSGRQAPQGRTETLARLEGQLSPDAEAVQYVASFASQAEAQAHADSVRGRGGRIELLDSGGRTQKAVATRSQLLGATIPADALVSAATPVRAIAPREGLAGEDPGQLAGALLTARKVVGVDALLARFPGADGRGLKVAVFDTGIDFGVEGITLAGFFDLTDFGRVQATALPADFPQARYAVDGRELRFAADVKPREALAAGVLDEAALARRYLAPEGADLDANGKPDRIAFVSGTDASGAPAVWLDLDADGVLSATEELSDFNRTHEHLDLRKDLAPSGARALAVTVHSPTDLQFHAVLHGHGTSCGMIIAGHGYADGKLRGMAPKAGLVSYLLDVSGQDVYTMDQLVRMFLHARDQGVSGISISYGFTTADLGSARFLADFLDREIASKGILIGIAAGNNGPGVSSVPYDDYIPHHGLGVGAMISSDQARNVYGWTGAVEDSIVFYSGVGPTRGGRQVPDISSPLMTWVRGERGTASGPFYSFSGTSSATPALMGAATALQSALIQAGHGPLDMRLLKLALQGSARALDNVERLRQGAGVIDVDQAYDLYLRLAGELKSARADASRRTPFAYELLASTPLEKRVETGEGVHYHSYKPTAHVTVSLSKASLALVDPLVFFEALAVEHDGKFFEAASVLKLQATGAKLGLAFDAQALSKPGVYTDVIRLKRPSDGLTLLSIPVVIEIADEADHQGTLARVAREVGPLEVPRFPIRLAEASAVNFDALVQQVGDGPNVSLNLVVQNEAGIAVVKSRYPLERAFTALDIQLPKLAAGDYEALLYLSFGQPATLVPARIDGAFRLPVAKLLAAERSERGVRLAIQGGGSGSVTVAKAALQILGTRASGALERNAAASLRPGFEATLDLGRETDRFDLSLRLDALDRALFDILAMEVTVLDAATDLPLAREWVDFSSGDEGIRKRMALAAPARQVRLLAYPNVVKWDGFKLGRFALDAIVPFAGEALAALRSELKLEKPLVLQSLQTAELSFVLGEGFAAPAGAVGTLELQDASGKAVERLPLAL